MPDGDVRLCIAIPRDTLARMSEGGVLDVPVTDVTIEDGVLVTNFRVGLVEGLTPLVAATLYDDWRGPGLRLYLRPEE